MTDEQVSTTSEVRKCIGALIQKLGPRVWFDTRADFAQKLQSKYGAVESEKYVLYHIMIGGSPGEAPLFDFPEPDSIYIWLKNQLNPTE